MNVVRFPKQFRHPLPADAPTSQRVSSVYVFPDQGKWAVLESDDGGGSLFTFRTRDEALAAGIDWLRHRQGALVVQNSSIYEEERA